MTVYYHGGVAGLRRGNLILPPAETGAVSIADVGVPTSELAAKVARNHRKDRVYLTARLDVARVFASLAVTGRKRGGDVYRVEPLGEIEVDMDYLLDDGGSVQVARARVVEVVARRVPRPGSRP
jgi:hypothetical protein